MALIDQIASGGFDVGPKLRQGFQDRMKAETHEQNKQMNAIKIRSAKRQEDDINREDLWKQKLLLAKTKKDRKALYDEGAVLYPKTVNEQTKTILNLKRKDLMLLKGKDKEVLQLFNAYDDEQAPPEAKQEIYGQMRQIAEDNGIPVPPEDINTPEAQRFLKKQRFMVKHSQAATDERLQGLKIEGLETDIGLGKAKTGYYRGRNSAKGVGANTGLKARKLLAQIKKIESSTKTPAQKKLETEKLKAQISKLKGNKSYAIDKKIKMIMRLKGVSEDTAFELANAKTRKAFDISLTLSLAKSGLYDTKEIKAKVKEVADSVYTQAGKPRKADAIKDRPAEKEMERQSKEIEKQITEKAAKTYKSKDEVGAAYKKGKITKEEAMKILNDSGW